MLSIEKQIVYLISCASVIEVQELVLLYEADGRSGQYIRNVLARLKKMGYIESVERSRYRITEVGDSFVRSFNQKPELSAKEWDRKWQLVMFEFPDGMRKHRQLLVSHLRILGFGRLYDSVYISPWDQSDNLKQYVAENKLEPYLTIAAGCAIPDIISSRQAGEIWPLDEINRMYMEKEEGFLADFLSRAERPQADDRETFLLFLEIGNVISEMGLIDPILPACLLPGYWRGNEILGKMFACMRRLGSALPSDSVYRKYVRL
ncbi:PaaX family transcriptional regulator C-terminal domain-containing protein [Paenibacillus sabinae]|uniref:PaaX family transcriptional regulator n=1 Tax=Paenibacillus sabinae T27 TaxID=1268072 RepID=X4Z5V3_9BACL|nr:PaaX family transcriptional regulator C-terminal domain-containing protein [Paenibacillus sabinae]AHV95156.1 PaaX family transcriptional regulator [Paenibacillus sabinae T27]